MISPLLHLIFLSLIMFPISLCGISLSINITEYISLDNGKTKSMKLYNNLSKFMYTFNMCIALISSTFTSLGLIYCIISVIRTVL